MVAHSHIAQVGNLVECYSDARNPDTLGAVEAGTHSNWVVPAVHPFSCLGNNCPEALPEVGHIAGALVVHRLCCYTSCEAVGP